MLAFVSGTLTDPERTAAVFDDWAYDDDAVLSGLHRVEGEYPTLAPGGRVDGRLLRTDEVDRLDAYEGVDRGLYVWASVRRVDGGSAQVYVGDPDVLDAPADWPGTGPFEARVRSYVADHDVVVRTARDRQD